MTGLRVGEVYRLRAADFDREAGTVRVSADTKTGKPRVVPVSSEAVVFLSGLAAERIGKALLFTRDDGVAWDGNEAAKRFRELRNTLGLSDELVLYCVRHRWISRACGQMEIGQVALIAGTSVEMIQEFYAKLSAVRARADLDKVASIKRAAPSQG